MYLRTTFNGTVMLSGFAKNNAEKNIAGTIRF